MKILAFTDTHGSEKAIKKIAKKAKKEKPDLLIFAGDLTIFEQGLDYLIHLINKIGITALMLPGNHESAANFKKACSMFKNIVYAHKTSFTKNNYLFVGYGGGGFSMTDKNFLKTMKKFNSKISKTKKFVLILHQPPYNTKLDQVMEEHCGNKTFAKFIKDKKPNLVICGHLHENEGKEDKVGKTRIINPGPYGKILRI